MRGGLPPGAPLWTSFCKAVENGGTGELTLYTFAPNYADPETIWCSYTRFWTDGRLQLVLLRLLGGQQLRLYGTQPV